MDDAADGDARAESRATFRVRYPETDRTGVAYHAHYFVWFELGRTELMRELGRTYRDLEDRDGLHLPVVRAGARFLAPARYDDLLDVRTRVAMVGGARVRFEYRLTRGAPGEILATGFTEHATVGCEGRPIRMPQALKLRLLKRSS